MIMFKDVLEWDGRTYRYHLDKARLYKCSSVRRDKMRNSESRFGGRGGKRVPEHIEHVGGHVPSPTGRPGAVL